MARHSHAAVLQLALALLLWGRAGATRVAAADQGDDSSAAPAASASPRGAGLFVAVGYGGFRGWSADGETWTAERWSDKNADDINIIFSLTERNGILLCSGGGVGKGFILRSVDGKRWDEVARTRWRIPCVLALADRFLSVFDDHFQTSTGGVKWKQQAAAVPRAADGKGGGYFRRWAAGKGVVVFADDYALEAGRPRVGWLGSTRLGNTRLELEKQAADVRGLEFGNDRFVACTQAGQILTSDDGLKFVESARSGDEHDDGAVRFFERKFYLRGRHGVTISTDGKNWESLAKPPHLPRAVAPNGVAIDCGWGGIQVAPDGKTFRKANVPIDPTGVTSVLYAVPAANRSK